jgi:hypothetical protein
MASELESNNTYNTATHTSLDTPTSGQLSDSSDQDFFRIDLENSGILNVDLDLPTDHQHIDSFTFSVLDVEGNTITEHRTGAGGNYRVLAQSAGAYYVGISVGHSFYYDDGIYEFTASLDDVPLEQEPNDTSGSSTSVVLGQSIAGRLSSGTDEDYFALELESAGIVDISLNQASENTNYPFAITLLHSDGTLLGRFLSSDGGDYQIANPESGTYYVGVSAESLYRFSSEHYEITVNHENGFARQFEREGNDSTLAANSLTMGESISGQLAFSDDLDFYVFSVDEAGAVDIELDLATNYGQAEFFSLSILDQQGQEMARYNTGQNGTYPVGLAEAGIYYLSIGSSEGRHDSGVYSITVKNTQESSNAFEFENNNTIGTANRLPLGVATTGQVSSNSDSDFFSVEVTSAGFLTIELDIPELTHSYRNYFALRLRNSEGELLQHVETRQDSTYSFPVHATGTYFVEISGTDEGGFTSGAYQLFASLTSGGLDGLEIENNNSMNSATAIHLDENMSGQVVSNTDRDYFFFTVEDAGTLTAALDVSSNNQYYDYLEFSILDAAGTPLATYPTGADKPVKVALPAAGTYFAEWSAGFSYNHLAYRDYEFSLSFSEGDTTSVESEPNHTQSTADELSIGISINGQLIDKEDQDYYSVNIDEPGILDVTLDLPTISSYEKYFSLEFLDETGTLQSRFMAGMNGNYKVAAPEAGTYYFRIATANDYLHDSGSYELTTSISSATAAGYEIENNDNLADANILIAGNSVIGQLLSTDDRDYYRLEFTEPGLLNIEFDAPSDQYRNNFKLAFHDNEGNNLDEFETGRDSSFRLAVHSAGTYFVSLTSASSHDDRNYQLNTDFVAAPTDGYEQEVNGTPATASTLTLNTDMIGHLTNADDVDYFAVTFVEAGVVDIDLDVPTNRTSDYFNLNLSNDEETILSQFQTGRDEVFSTYIAEPGTYYIGLSATGRYSFDSGDYRFNVSITSDSSRDFEREDNDSLMEANTIILDGTMNGQLASSDDQDFYQVDIDSAGLITIELDVPTSSNSDIFRLSVRNAEGAEIARYHTGQDKTYLVAAPDAGRYYVEVGTAMTNAFDSGTYGITLSHSSGSNNNYELESNNTPNTANPIELGQAVTGQLASEIDEDLYRFSVGEIGLLDISMAVPTDSWQAYFRLTLLDANGSPLARQSMGRDQVVEFSTPYAGDYFLQVSGEEHYLETDNYTFTASHTATSLEGLEIEGNDSIENANSLALGQNIAGQLVTIDDVDFYAVEVDTSGHLQINLNVVSTNYYDDHFAIKVLNSEGLRLEQWQSWQDDSFSVTVHSAGIYYIAMSNNMDRYNSGAYEISVDHIAEPIIGQEVENNDSLQNATPIDPGNPITGYLIDRDDRDVFSFDVDSPSALQLNLTSLIGNSSQTRYFLQLLDSEGKTLANFHVQDNSIFYAAAPEAGLYYLEVSPYSSNNYSLEDYALEVNLTAMGSENFEIENNDQIAQANPLDLHASVIGQLSNAEDVDLYEIETDSSGVLSIDVDVPTDSSSDHYTFSLLDNEGTELVQYRTGRDEDFRFAAHAAATYYLKVSTESSYYFHSGNYTLTTGFSEIPADAFEQESNDDLASANAIAIGGTKTGQLSRGDKDSYKVDIDSPVLLTTGVTVDEEEVVSIEVFTQQGEQIASARAQGQQDYSFLLPAAGSYYFRLSSYDTINSYHFSVNEVSSPLDDFESDHNDLLVTAQIIELGRDVIGTFEQSNTRDVYRVDIGSGGIIGLEVEPPEGAVSFSLTVMDQAGNVIVRLPSSFDRQYQIALTNAGTYFFEFQSDGNHYAGTSTYKFSVNQEPLPDGVFESEPNNSFETAEPLIMGRGIEGNLLQGDERDIYALTLDRPGLLSLGLESLIRNGFSRFSVKFYDNEGVLQAKESGWGEHVFTFAAHQAGIYYVELTPATGTTPVSDGYRLTPLSLDDFTQSYEQEDNDTAVGATELILGEPVAAQLMDNFDIDFFSVSVAGEGVLDLAFDLPTFGNDTSPYSMVVSDASGNVLSTYLVHGVGTRSLPLHEAGTYQISVSWSGYYYFSGFHYQLTADFNQGSTAAFEQENNDSRSEANELSLEQTLSGQLSSQADTDIYSIDVDNSGLLTIELEYPDNHWHYTNVFVFHEDGRELAYFQALDQSAFHVTTENAGRYYIQLSADRFYYRPEVYRLSVSHDTDLADAFESESNENSTSANSLALNSTIAGQIANEHDTDLYELVIDEEGVLTLDFNVPTHDFYDDDFRLSVLNEQGLQLVQFQTGVDRVYEAAIRSAGTYYLSVSAGEEFSYPRDTSAYVLTTSLAAGDTGHFELEDNDNPEHANVIVAGQTINGQIVDSSDQDHFRFETSDAAVLNVHFDAPFENSEDYYSLSLLNGDGNLINTFGISGDTSLLMPIANAGVYTLRVTSEGYWTHYDSDPYAISTELLPSTFAVFEVDHNNTLDLATDIELNQAINGQLLGYDDQDYFAVTVDSIGILSVELDLPTDDPNYSTFVFTVLDGNGQLLARHLTGSDGIHRVITEAAGTYYLGLSGDSHNDFDSGPYRITASHVSGSVEGLEFELNDSLSSANIIGMDTSISGQIIAPPDKDYFAFDISLPGTLSVDFDTFRDRDWNAFTLTLLDESGNRLAEYRTGADQDFKLSLAESGRYFLGISATNDYDYSSDTYQFTLSHEHLSWQAEIEKNDSAVNATPLLLGQEMTGQLLDAIDNDFFAVEVTEAGIVGIDFNLPDREYGDYFILSLLDEQQESLAYFETGTSDYFQAAIREPGIYYLRLSTNNDRHQSSGVYQVSVEFDAGTQNLIEQEDNNSLDTAEFLNLGSNKTGQIAGATDQDFYAIDLDDRGVLSLFLDTPSTSGTNFFTLSLFDSEGVEITEFSTGNDRSYHLGVDSGGRYYIGIAPFGTDRYDTGNYQLAANLEEIPLAQFESDGNDSLRNADRLSLETATNGWLSNQDKVDTYSLNLGGAGNLNLDLNVLPGNTLGDITITVFDENRENLVRYTTTHSDSLTLQTHSEGLYYVVISAEDNSSWENYAAYQLTVSHDGPEPQSSVNTPVAGSIEILGDTREGETLTVNAGLNDPDGLGDLNYQWYADGDELEGETGVNLNLRQEHTGKQIHVIINFTDAKGHVERLGSAATAAVTDVSESRYGDEGDNILIGTKGDDDVFGGAGTDIYAVRYLPSQYIYLDGAIQSDEGNDQLSDIEYIGFGHELGDAFTVNVELQDLIDPDGSEGELESTVSQQLDKLSDLYLAYFGRAPNTTGLSYWFKELYSGSMTFADIATSFSQQPEYQSTYPAGSSSSDFVSAIYQNLFNRAPAQKGHDYWVAELDRGLPKELFILAVINAAYSPTGGEQDRALLRNKHDVSMYYVEQLMLHSDREFEYGISEVLSAVSFDTRTVEAAKEVIDYSIDSDNMTLENVIENQALWNSFWIS